jgi:hypothetical protein
VAPAGVEGGFVGLLRRPWVVPVAIGVLVLAIVTLNWHFVASALNDHPLLRAELAICAGALPGFMAATADPNRRRRHRSTKLDHLLADVAAKALPAAPGYTHYLPCVLLGSGKLAASQPARGPAMTSGMVGGFLFVGPAGMQFQSADSTEGSRFGADSIDPVPGPIDMGPIRELVATPVALVHPALSRAADGKRYALQVRWPGGLALFGVPTVGDTLPSLHRCLDVFKWGKAATRLPAGPSAVL